MYSVGIDVGASSVKVVALSGGVVVAAYREVHKGAVVACAKRLLEEVSGELAGRTCAGVAATGQGVDALRDALAAYRTGAGARKGAELGLGTDARFGAEADLGTDADLGADARFGAQAPAGGLLVLEEVPAATLGAQVLAPSARSIMCIGGQSALFVALPEGSGVPDFATNDSCASGTGSFFEDQMARLGLGIEDYSELVARASSVPRLSGRCTVFAKTDIIHRQQEGVAVEDILLGLCHAMVKSFKATIVRGIAWKPPLALAGGVVLNQGVVDAVREVFKLGEGELVASPNLVYLQAAGAARAAWDAALAPADADAGACADAAFAAWGDVLLRALIGALGCQRVEKPLPRLEPLPRLDYEPGLGYPADHLLVGEPERGGRALGARGEEEEDESDAPVLCALGVDVGSTSTNLVLLDLDGNVLDAQYLRTRGNPRAVVADGLASIGRRLGGRVSVVAAGTTGSGRDMIGHMIGADVVRDEITAQARAAAAADARVDTVFEIGGQDSKYIHLADGQVSDFQMNKVCAAGTGSFVEEQAVRLGISLDEYGPLALDARCPVDLGDRCTVFVETAIHTALAKGAELGDVAAGLCQSIVRNYLYRVVGGKPVGKRIVLQGGVAYNPGIVAAFKQVFGDSLTVSPWFAVSGAVGVALLALESCGALGSCTNAPANALANAPAPAASNSSGRLSAALPVSSSFRGFFLERDAHEDAQVADSSEIAANRAYFRQVDQLFLEGYDPVRDPAKKTVGIPRCLMMHKLFPMANAFFRELGYNVVLSDESSEDTVRLSQQASQGEVCYPVKLVHGHMIQLLDAGVDYIFFPAVHTIRHLKSKSAHNYACSYMQTAPQLLAHELEFEKRGVELISPMFEMDWGQDELARALLGVGEQLGHDAHASAMAMLAAGFAVREFTRRTEELGEELLNSLGPTDRVIVLITRQYGILDPALNMGIADALLDRGQKVIMVSHLHAHDLDISRDYPGVYWPFGQHIISGAKLVRRDPRLFAVYLTNHGCGPDTMVSHYFRDEMGDKPYLQIEMDEHYSKVGVITRLEAFLNAIDHYQARDERALPLSVARPNAAAAKLRRDVPAVMPSVGLLGRFAARAVERASGVPVALAELDAQAVAAGKRETESKEYLTFAAFLGASLAFAQGFAQESAQGFAQESAQKPLQILLPSTEGTEADGQYDRVIRVILDEKGAQGVRLTAPRLEQLPWTLDDPLGLFAALLAADVCYAAPSEARDEVAARLLSGDLSLERVENAAREVSNLWKASANGAAACGADTRRTGDSRGASNAFSASDLAISVIGEWPLVYADELTGGVLSRLEAEGMRLVRMPFSEYLLFLWRDAVDADQRERDNKPFMLDMVGERGLMQLPAEALAAEEAASAEALSALEGALGHDCASCADDARKAACDVARAAGRFVPGNAGEELPQGVFMNAEGMYTTDPTRRDLATYAHITPASDNASAPGVHFYGTSAPSSPATDNLEFDAYKLPNFAISTDEKLRRLEPYFDAMARVVKALGEASPFAASFDDLRAAADQAVGPYRGGNGRYRAAKTAMPPKGARGTLALASMYENTDIMLKLREGFFELPVPALHVGFDGVLDKSIEGKIRSFVYYL